MNNLPVKKYIRQPEIDPLQVINDGNVLVNALNIGINPADISLVCIPGVVYVDLAKRIRKPCRF